MSTSVNHDADSLLEQRQLIHQRWNGRLLASKAHTSKQNKYERKRKRNMKKIQNLSKPTNQNQGNLLQVSTARNPTDFGHLPKAAVKEHCVASGSRLERQCECNLGDQAFLIMFHLHCLFLPFSFHSLTGSVQDSWQLGVVFRWASPLHGSIRLL